MKLIRLLLLVLATMMGIVPSAVAQTTPGVTFRLYDIRESMDKLYPLSGTPTPNLHENRTNIDYNGGFSNSGYGETYTNNYLIELSGEINASKAGSYSFRLTSDDGSILTLDGDALITHDGLRAADPAGEATKVLTAGYHPFLLRNFQNTGAALLKLEWKTPGDTTYSIVPASAFRTEVAVLVSSPGKKNIIRPGSRPGNGQPLVSSHPQWQITDISTNGFAPKIGDMAFLPNGDMLVATFEPNRFNADITTYNAHTRLYRMTGVGGDPANVTVTHVAGDGLAGSFSMTECTGMAVMNGEVYVALRENIYRVRDTNGDGVFDQKTPILATNWEYHNFHQFTFSLTPVRENNKDYLYGTISTAVRQGDGGAVANKSDYNGSLFRVEIPAEGAITNPEYLAGGLRTPNGVSIGPEGRIFVADNQGSWNPSNSLTEMRAGRFYGHRNPTTVDNGVQGVAGRFENQPVSPKSFLLPQGTLSNSPTEGVMLDSGPYAGQMILGELTAGGLRRVYFDKVQGEYQGAVFHFAQGFEAGVNRVVKGPDGSLYIGCMGSGGNWSWKGLLTGLARFSPIGNAPTVFEMKSVKAIAGGLEIEFTESVPAAFLTNVANFTVKQWTYMPTSAYGGANVDEQAIVPSAAVANADRKRVQLYLPTLKEGYCVYIKTDPISDNNQQMWTTEAWYTLNRKVPSEGKVSSVFPVNDRIEAETGIFTNGPSVASNHAGYTGSGFVQGMGSSGVETVTLTVQAPSAGNFPVTMRYARGSQSGVGTLTTTGKLDIAANGGATVTFALPMTTDWSNWQTTSPVNLTLQQGANTIVLRNPYDNDGICNIDRFDFNFGSSEQHRPTTLSINRTTVPPGLRAGTAIANLSATDPDGGALSYELGFNSFDFEVQGNKLRLKHDIAAGSYPVAARVVDSMGYYKEELFTINVAPGPDADGDGIDDNWESLNQMNSGIDDGGIDLDGDGQTNRQEYAALTDPNNAADVFALTNWVRNGSQVLLQVPSRLSRFYQLQNSLDLVQWDDIGLSVAGNGGVIELADFASDSSDARTFYRVEVTR